MGCRSRERAGSVVDIELSPVLAEQEEDAHHPECDHRGDEQDDVLNYLPEPLHKSVS